MSLVIKNLTKSFGEKVLFKDFSYSFDDTGIYILKGKSGIGKTTLLRIIAGLDTDYSGEIHGGGIQNVSFCFQEHRLFPLISAFNNILKVSFKEDSETNKELTRSLLSKLSFTDSDMKLSPEKLSGGMRQRVDFARAVLKKSKILILDEATKELDSALSEKILAIIKEESKKRLIIMVTHKEDEIEKLNAKVIFVK